MVLISRLSAESAPSDYKPFCEDESSNQGKGRPMVLIPHDRIRDQRVVADQATDDFRTLLQSVFYAEEQTTGEASAAPSTDVSSYFTWVHHEGGEIRALATDKLVKLDSLSQKVTANGRLSDIPIHDLCRLQKLCAGDLMIVQSLELSINGICNNDDFSAWLQRAGLAESALRSARIIFRIMIGINGEKKVCSEEVLQHLVSVLNQIFNSCIIPVVEARPKDYGADFLKLLSAHKKEISQLLHQTSTIMKMLVEMLGKMDTAEIITTGLEFFAIRILFVENAQLEKESILGIQEFEASRRIAMDIIVAVFAKYTEQRPFIFDEILSSLQKLPTKGQNVRHFKLSDGTTIQLVSALIMRLVQTSAAPAQSSVKGKQPRDSAQHKHSLSRSEALDSEAEESSNVVDDSEGSQASSADSKADTDVRARQQLSEKASELSSNAARDAQYVMGYLVRRAMTASKTGHQPHRQLLDMFAEDLILVLNNAEWPAAELLLNVLMSIMMNLTEKKSTAPAKIMALELLGSMGSAIPELVAETQSLARNLENQDSKRSVHLRHMFDEYPDGRFQTSELLAWDGPYRIVLDFLASIDSEGLPTRSAQVFYLTQWARSVCLAESMADSEKKLVTHHLQKRLSDKAWNPS